MGTYNIEKLLKEYGSEKISVEMALGHSLQHIEILDDAKKKASASRYQLNEHNKQQDAKIEALEIEVNLLRQKVTKISTLQREVKTLVATVQQQKNEIDSLKTMNNEQ